MTPGIALAPAIAQFDFGRAKAKSPAHKIALALVWVTIAISAIVLKEPAPVDAMTIGLMVLLPVIGLVEGKAILWAGFVAVFMMTASGFVSAALARDGDLALSHMTVSFYLIGAWFLFAGFVAKRPERHTRLILNAYMVAGIVAALCGIAGYLDLFPGAFDLFTRYGRASGPFKDPNVFGPFLVAPLLTALHLWLVRPLNRGILPLIAAAILAVGVLFSFSRGAWAAAGIGIGIYGYLYSITATRNWDRVKLAALVLVSAAILGLILAAAFRSEAIGDLLEQRTALTQSYDRGPDGRFGGQMKAVGLILDNVTGLGAQNFSRYYHHEEVHNVYLSMFLNAGWVGGILYFMICAGTLAAGFVHALKNTRTRPLFFIVFAALAGNICEGVLIDSDHWRHFYLLMALVWGLIAADRRQLRRPRIVADLRPVLLRSALLIPPSRRQARIVKPARHLSQWNAGLLQPGKNPGWRLARGRIIAALA
jgi:O-antigen ligase